MRVLLKYLPLIILTVAMLLPCNVLAGKKTLRISEIEEVEIYIGKSIILESDARVRKVSIADPATADVMMLTPRRIYMNGKTSGMTTLTLWGDKDKLLYAMDVSVRQDTTNLKKLLYKLLPEEENLQIIAAKDTISVAGTVQDPASITTAMSLAEAYAPGKVINLVNVGGVHQVMLEVRIAEVSRSVLKRLGFNLAYINTGQLLDGEVFFTFLNALTGYDENGDFRLSKNVNSAFTFRDGGGGNWSAFIDALKENGLVKMLAEPNVICLSGQTGSFLAGGEIPVPVPQGLGTVAIEYRPFGVGLEFRPTVLGNGRINIEVMPEVSDLDYANAITLNGATIPAITTRKVETSVELQSGQSFAVAGLVKDNMRESISKFPGLGDVPVLGTLFRSSEFQKFQSELVIIVTPHLVKPLDASKQTLPTDGIIEPNDVEFYLMGKLEGKPEVSGVKPINNQVGNPELNANSVGFDGQVGHTVTIK